MSSILKGRSTQKHAAGGKRKKLVAPLVEAADSDSEAGSDSDNDSPNQTTKKPKRRLNSSTIADEEENVERKSMELSSSTHIHTTSSTPSTPAAAPPILTNAFKSVRVQAAIDALLRVPLPNVLADMVMVYLFHPQSDLWELWEEIISAYKSLPQMVSSWKDRKETVKEELMPKLQLSPPASPMEVDELEQQFQLKYDDPNFHFSSELKFLWSIADGLEASQNMIFRGRFWPSLTTMRAILECHEDSYYVIYHYHANRTSAWLKYDFRSGVIYAVSALENVEERFNENRVVIIYHSVTHFMKALLATLKLAFNGEDSQKYRLDHDVFWDPDRPDDNPHPPAIDINQTRGFVSLPTDLDAVDRWRFWVVDPCMIQPDQVLIPGHLTSLEYASIRESICAHENKWIERVMNLSDDEKWVKRAPDKTELTTTTHDVHMTDEYVPEGEYGATATVDADEAAGASHGGGGYEYYGYPLISSCHLLDEFDGYWN